MEEFGGHDGLLIYFPSCWSGTVYPPCSLVSFPGGGVVRSNGHCKCKVSPCALASLVWFVIAALLLLLVLLLSVIDMFFRSTNIVKYSTLILGESCHLACLSLGIDPIIGSGFVWLYLMCVC